MIAVIDYNSGNTESLCNALSTIGVDFTLTNSKASIQNANRVILPGVGRASQCMAELQELGLVEIIKNIRKPFLGICVGMQILYEFSEEDNTPCLKIIPGTIQEMKSKDLPLPHMGWNTLNCGNHPLFKDLPDNNYVYFVHSYAACVDANTLASSMYQDAFTAVVGYKNFVGMQFHPEKSGDFGMKLLKNFCNLDIADLQEEKYPPHQLDTCNNLTKRIIACMDIDNGRIVKGTNFKNIRDAGDPVERAKLYCQMGIDELVFLDITATVEDRDNTYALVTKVASQINIPFTVGGGIQNTRAYT